MQNERTIRSFEKYSIQLVLVLAAILLAGVLTVRVPSASASNSNAPAYTCDNNGICYCTGGSQSADCKSLGSSKDCGEKIGCDDKGRCYCTGGPGAPQNNKGSSNSNTKKGSWSTRLIRPPKP